MTHAYVHHKTLELASEQRATQEFVAQHRRVILQARQRNPHIARTLLAKSLHKIAQRLDRQVVPCRDETVYTPRTRLV